MADVPATVTAALTRASDAGFELSCDPAVGELLAALAAAVPEGGRILELGTGAGVGLAWILAGLGERSDAEVVTVDVDASLQEATRSAGWPAFVKFVLEDGAEVVKHAGPFDLVFADAPGGKLTGLEDSIAALSSHGVLFVDDMDLTLHRDAELRELLADVRRTLVGHPALVTVELAHGSGVILSVRRPLPGAGP